MIWAYLAHKNTYGTCLVHPQQNRENRVKFQDPSQIQKGHIIRHRILWSMIFLPNNGIAVYNGTIM